MIKIKKITCVLLVASVICALSSITAYAMDPIVSDVKVESSATVEDDFDDDKVLVLLSQESSWTFKEYTASDFSEIDCKKVVSLMSALTDVGKKGDK